MATVSERLDEINERCVRIEERLPVNVKVRLDRLEQRSKFHNWVTTTALGAGITALVTAWLAKGGSS